MNPSDHKKTVRRVTTKFWRSSYIVATELGQS